MKRSRKRLKRVRPLLGTYVEISLQAEVDEQTLHAWITDGFEAVAEIDRLLSHFRPDSDLARLNREAWKQPVRVNPRTYAVVQKALDISRASEGWFDATLTAQSSFVRLLPGKR